MRKFIIDTDTASDDVVAIIMALREPSFEIVALTTVAGNVTLDCATRNACISVEMAKTYTPDIYMGCNTPLVREQMLAAAAHGENGLSGVIMPDPVIKPKEKHAVNAIIDIIRQGDGGISIMTIGPLTNIALALRKAPDIVEKIPEIVMMGGAQLTYSADTPVAEFNVRVDPEASKIVFDSGIPIVMVPLEACYEGAEINEEDIAEIKGYGSETATFCIDCNAQLQVLNMELVGRPIISFPDPSTVAVAAKPELINKSYKGKVTVDIFPTLTYGQTVIDTKSENPNTTIVASLHGKEFKDYVKQLIKE